MSQIKIKQKSKPKPDESRQCGECTACCTVLGVIELDKQSYTPCQHLCDKGCSIYPNRPKSCREFKCLWLYGMFSEEHRPDKLGIVFHLMENTKFGDILTAYEVSDNVSTLKPEARILLEMISEKLPVMITNKQARTIIGPPDQVAKIHQTIKTTLEEKS